MDKIWVIEKTVMTSGPQKWDEGPNDKKYLYPETTHEVFNTMCAAEKTFGELKHFQAVKMFECVEVKSKFKPE